MKLIVDKDVRLAFINATSFHEAALRCRFPADQIEVSPMIVNYALACELYLKSLLMANETPDKRNHDLAILFDKIPLELRRRVEDIFKSGSGGEECLAECLRDIGDAFVKWRYLHEFKIPRFRLGVLERFTQSLLICIGRYLPHLIADDLPRFHQLPRLDSRASA